VVTSLDKNTQYSLEWDNLKTPSNKGKIPGQINLDDSSIKISNEQLSVTLTDSPWNLMSPNKIRIDTSGSIFVEPMSIVNNAQSINISGALSPLISDSLLIVTENVILEQFNRLLQVVSLKLEGKLNGNITLSKVNHNFAFNGDVNLTQLKINDNSVGQLQVNTVYYTKEKIIRLSGYTSLGIADESGDISKNISFKGVYYP
jgi:hypothetical protein